MDTGGPAYGGPAGTNDVGAGCCGAKDSGTTSGFARYGLGVCDFSGREQADFAGYQALVKAAGIECLPLIFQYASRVDAAMQAAQRVRAAIVFARMPNSRIPFWTKLQVWRQQCRLVQYPLDDAQVLMPAPGMERRPTAASRHSGLMVS